MITEDEQTHLIKLCKSLTLVATKLNSLNLKWLLGASCALLVHGVDIIPRDIDILVTPQNLGKVCKEFKQYIVERDGNNIQMDIGGVEVEIITVSDLGSPKIVTFENIPMPVNTLENELFYYKQRPGKEKTIKLIEEKLLANANSRTPQS